MYFPIHLDVCEMKITLVGGGKIAWRKCQFFIHNKIPVTVVAKEFLPAFKKLPGEIVRCMKEEYKVDHIRDSDLVIAATNNAELNAEIGAYCKQQGKLVNVASSTSISNFIMPGIVQRGDLLLSVSTSGKSPSLTKEIKQALQKQYGPEYANKVQDRVRERER